MTKLDLRRQQFGRDALPHGPLGALARRCKQIYLQDNELTGVIPDLRGLTGLTRLDLARNQLSGSIPALGALTSLTHIYLQDNELTGSIPALGGLTSLTHTLGQRSP